MTCGDHITVGPDFGGFQTGTQISGAGETGLKWVLGLSDKSMWIQSRLVAARQDSRVYQITRLKT